MSTGEFCAWCGRYTVAEEWGCKCAMPARVNNRQEACVALRMTIAKATPMLAQKVVKARRDAIQDAAFLCEHFASCCSEHSPAISEDRYFLSESIRRQEFEQWSGLRPNCIRCEACPATDDGWLCAECRAELSAGAPVWPPPNPEPGTPNPE